MAANIITLYPPIVETYMPAFVIDKEGYTKNFFRIYFKLSLYNDISDIEHAQVTIRNQYTNLNMLNIEKYPSEIMLTPVYCDDNRTTDDKYYIEVLEEDIKNSRFEYDLFYKVQIRFTDINIEDKININNYPQKINNWLNSNENKMHFSEWSTNCLISGIGKPLLNLKGFSPIQDNYWDYSSNVIVSGELKNDNVSEVDTLKYYTIKLYQNKNNILKDSGIIYADNLNNRNTIYYDMQYRFTPGEAYFFDLEYTTQRLYTQKITYKFYVTTSFLNKLEATISANNDRDNGRIGVSIVGDSTIIDSYSGDIIIRRTSSDTNFTIWEDLKILSVPKLNNFNITWFDYTIENGTFYIYSAQKIDKETGSYGTAIEIEEPIMAYFDSAFLVSKDRQLELTFDTNISSLKPVVTNSITTTLGSQYPFVKRNGNVNYLQFPIGGLITCQQDSNYLFYSLEEIYNGNTNLYKTFNTINHITINNDYVLEKIFREKVIDFLNNDSVYLFKSPTEGNILIKISDISLSPNTTLGRMIWSFSGTANQIDKNSIENYQKYQIIDNKKVTRLDFIPNTNTAFIIADSLNRVNQ